MNKTKLLSLILATSAIPLSIDATLLHIPGVPPKLAMCWPLILAVASAIHKIASTFQTEEKK